VGSVNLIANVPLAEFFFAVLLPRGFALALWALTLSIIKSRTKSLDFQAVRGIAYSLPIVVLSLGLANFSLAGFPLLAGFPVRAVLGINIAQQNAALAGLTLFGYFGLVIAAIRSISILLKNQERTERQVNETRTQIFLLVSGCLILFIVGLFPQIIISGQRVLLP
jgi:formate hydrogenlyase subunit 3/multisubunit Na+/H+ antiporter MnhD subunit